MVKCITVLGMALLAPAASFAGGVRGVSADGVWDCTDDSGTYLGAIVLADEAYAFLKPDGHIDAYGKLMRLTENTHLPAFAVINGPVKDELGASAMALLGPRENTEDYYSGDLFLYVAVDPDYPMQCIGRQRAGT